MTVAAAAPPGGPEPRGRAAALAAEAALLRDASPHSPQRGGPAGSGIEEYAHALEMKLTMKTTLLEEAARLHHSLEERLVALEEGISWKDEQLSLLERQVEEAWERATELFRDRDAWRERAERLEEENCALRDTVLESAEKNDRLMQLLEVQQQAINCPSPPQRGVQSLPGDEEGQQAVLQDLAQQLKEAAQRNVLLEEQLRIRSGSEPVGREALELQALLELGALPPQDAWAAVGTGEADRFCGVTPHRMVLGSAAGSTGCELNGGSGTNVATGGSLPEDPEEMALSSGSRLSSQLDPGRGQAGGGGASARGSTLLAPAASPAAAASGEVDCTESARESRVGPGDIQHRSFSTASWRSSRRSEELLQAQVRCLADEQQDGHEAGGRPGTDDIRSDALGSGCIPGSPQRSQSDFTVNVLVAAPARQPLKPPSPQPSHRPQHLQPPPVLGEKRRLTPQQMRGSAPGQAPGQAVLSAVKQRVIQQSPQLAARERGPAGALVSPTQPITHVYRGPTGAPLASSGAPPASTPPPTGQPPPPSTAVGAPVGLSTPLPSVMQVPYASASRAHSSPMRRGKCVQQG